MKIVVTKTVGDESITTQVEGSMHECVTIWVNLLAIDGRISEEARHRILSKLVKEKEE